MAPFQQVWLSEKHLGTPAAPPHPTSPGRPWEKGPRNSQSRCRASVPGQGLKWSCGDTWAQTWQSLFGPPLGM